MRNQLDLDLGRAGRDEGMARAARKANRVNGDWTNKALAMFFQWCLENKGRSFMTEDVRWWAEESGLPPPPDKRAWGAIATTARRKGFVRGIGYAPQKAANSHAAPKTVWVAV